MVDGAGSTGRQAHGNAVKHIIGLVLGGLGGRGFALGDVGHSLGSFSRLKGHHLRFQAQQVGGMLKTWEKPCAGRYRVGHPAQNQGGAMRAHQSPKFGRD